MNLANAGHMMKSAIAGATMGAAILLAGASAQAAELPGEGVTVHPARATWDTGWFQTEIYIKALERLGYEVKTPKTLDNPPFYQAVSQGDVDFWVNGWFPIHNTYTETFEKGAEIVGYVAQGGALQGYLIDKKTAEKYDITSLEDFKKPEIRKLFDTDDDGKAELVACPPGWGCELVIAHQIEAYGLEDAIDPIKAGYSASMADAIGRYEAGEPVLFYTWTPNWTVGMLKPGRDVVWIEVPYPSLPDDQKMYEDKTTVPGVTGCVDDPCKMGWPANDIRPVANSEFLDKNPAIRALLEKVRIPLDDIFAQNAKMFEGEDKKADIKRHADEWIADHQKLFDSWIEAAVQAAS
ncbi:glycine betaine/L-proline ABC transporter substrate-binding protein ProX [Oceanibacterium hippocampi]|uniref:Glycine betaine-binding periplasmic protein n=1 Tax=Oceanibacterium hippocampi TaxID=745714 RepID=A0A1Y5RV13_9PROT|nr:glycine betaine/L-proline ABC transporter substrate-binding protein ProX [Oceanibacterium hippocampi]SLN25964.1 Glycine betaine-binding periplasmic protein precursor [Oceanibacterium hippocampi]